MGMARLNIWVSEADDPCGVDDQHQWFITVYDCDGRVLHWCGRKYVVIPAKCGHLQIEVPPGIYYLKAVWSYTAHPGYYDVNHFTDAAIVHAICDQTTCVKLFNPSIHRCGTIILEAAKDLLHQKLIKPELLKALQETMHNILAGVRKPIKGFELDHLDEIDKMVREAAEKGVKAE